MAIIKPSERYTTHKIGSSSDPTKPVGKDDYVIVESADSDKYPNGDDRVRVAKSVDIIRDTAPAGAFFPWVAGDGVIRSAVIGFILDIELYGTDFEKQYFLRYAGRNIDNEGAYKCWFAISTVSPLQDVAVLAAFDGATNKTFDEPISGVARYEIVQRNSSGITGYVLLNWDALVSGTEYHVTTPYAQRWLSKAVEKRVLPYITSENTSHMAYYPFQRGDAVLATVVKDFILFLEMFGTDPSKQYYLKNCGINRTGGSPYRSYFSIAETGTKADVAYLAEHPTPYWDHADLIGGKNIYQLVAAKSSGIYGQIVLNWDALVSGTNYNLANPTSRIFSQSVQRYTEAPEAINQTDCRLLIAPEMYLINEMPLPLYKRSIISEESNLQRDANVFIGRLDTGSPYMRHINHDYLIDPAEMAASMRIAMRLRDGTYAKEIYAYYKDVAINKIAGGTISGKVASVLIMGDSMTDGELASIVKAKLNTDLGTDLAFIGLRSYGGANHEGRSSWEYGHMIGLRTNYDSTHAVTPYLSGTDGSLYLNPFVHVATAEELLANPTWCFENSIGAGGYTYGKLKELNYTESQAIGTYDGDYYTLSIVDYVANHSITVGDKLILISNLGFNDLNHNDGSEASILQALLGIEVLIGRMAEYATANPTKSVHLGISILMCVQIHNKWAAFSSYLERAIVLIQDLKVDYEDVTNLEICIVPIWQHVSREWAYGFTGEAGWNEDNDTIKAAPSDALHPGTMGKKQEANVCVGFIANKL